MMGVIKAAQELIMRYAASGREYLSEWYLKVESNFAGLKTWTDSHLRGGSGYRHNADDVDYSGSIPQGNTVKEVLENTYDALEQEKQDRIAEDDAIRQDLQTEAAERKAEDNRLNTALEAEVTARETADSALQTALDLETDTRASEDSILRVEFQGGLEQEKQERTIEEEALRAALVAETAERESATAELRSSINAEKTERENADAAILQELSKAESSQELFSAMNKECVVIYQILGIECFDGGLFWDAQNDEILDGGAFEEELTEDVDFGDFTALHITAQVSANIDGGLFE